MNLPNKLTVFRIFLIPIFILLLVLPSFGTMNFLGAHDTSINQVVAGVVFIIASLTDLLDGKIARARKLVTNFGKFADPLADKLLVMTALIFLVQFGKASAWVISIIVIRELAVTGLRLLIVENNGQVMAAAYPGKIKTTTQMVAIILFYFNNAFFNPLGVPMAEIMLWIALFFTVYSGLDYFIQNRSVFNDGFK
ncbi:CDP-diacylglycerol--glycerol-3-phosphate 3-phosphatidyltransferase [Periweissella ghanensis]|uniref:CDP-diacylglycerol--glycerol-3-phosphate 3-phosphatidyltransferase n=1 Tax=Periweissella ghanensis TaxID=467997 RepID=A0ABN8BQ53_9LACO|nr:CDP-diacylglycerol--glycerol-3-phosphate 3-phosphatidyltransferase [Periweissella ghanensis]MCM0601774.1 CDP-diacylglycerol--glycerol-3-phosphate 3-phosphatidyltransferase [Periweissella ghanensis]CAH0418761.1 CDP-diacylglycerol--glycerol-3-phosphate 3-phosphatidyltransferase [Periweissella ghanensis]